jgi:hypothetical protein
MTVVVVVVVVGRCCHTYGWGSSSCEPAFKHACTTGMIHLPGVQPTHQVKPRVPQQAVFLGVVVRVHHLTTVGAAADGGGSARVMCEFVSGEQAQPQVASSRRLKGGKETQGWTTHTVHSCLSTGLRYRMRGGRVEESTQPLANHCAGIDQTALHGRAAEGDRGTYTPFRTASASALTCIVLGIWDGTNADGLRKPTNAGCRQRFAAHAS